MVFLLKVLCENKKSRYWHLTFPFSPDLHFGLFLLVFILHNFSSNPSVHAYVCESCSLGLFNTGTKREVKTVIVLKWIISFDLYSSLLPAAVNSPDSKI